MIYVYYKNFNPNKKLQNYLKTRLGKVNRKAPYQSFICCCFEKTLRDKYRAFININSSVGRFNVCAEKRGIENLVNKLIMDLSFQLFEWKDKRLFENSLPMGREKKNYAKNDQSHYCTLCLGNKCLIQSETLVGNSFVQEIFSY